jgi:hypothetical protein
MRGRLDIERHQEAAIQSDAKLHSTRSLAAFSTTTGLAEVSKAVPVLSLSGLRKGSPQTRLPNVAILRCDKRTEVDARHVKGQLRNQGPDALNDPTASASGLEGSPSGDHDHFGHFTNLPRYRSSYT